MTQLLVRSAATSSVVRGRRAANGDKIASVGGRRTSPADAGKTLPNLATVVLAKGKAMRMFHLAVEEWVTA